ncbi:putative transcriptional regulator [Streptococcus sp. NLAE-zl-C503]|nr:putative transcriptional regulator [Streptococcus sp. NLAE-zl-C503]
MIRVLEKNNYQNNIKQFRVREGLTQEELAKKINISRQMVGLIENNKTIPSVEIALKLSKVLKEPIERLFWF